MHLIALAHVNVEEATAINEAVIKGDLETAYQLLRVVRQGRLYLVLLVRCS